MTFGDRSILQTPDINKVLYKIISAIAASLLSKEPLTHTHVHTYITHCHGTTNGRQLRFQGMDRMDTSPPRDGKILESFGC